MSAELIYYLHLQGAPGIPGGSAISAGIKGEKGEQGFPVKFQLN